jgi:hypothetical protein
VEHVVMLGDGKVVGVRKRQVGIIWIQQALSP